MDLNKLKNKVKEHKRIIIISVLGIGSLIVTKKLLDKSICIAIGKGQDYGFIKGTMMAAKSFDDAVAELKLDETNPELYRQLAKKSADIFESKLKDSDFKNLLTNNK